MISSRSFRGQPLTSAQIFLFAFEYSHEIFGRRVEDIIPRAKSSPIDVQLPLKIETAPIPLDLMEDYPGLILA